MYKKKIKILNYIKYIKNIKFKKKIFKITYHII